MALVAIAEALERIIATAGQGTGREDVAIGDAYTRTLAEALIARRNQPPFDASAMDGYAVRSADLHAVPTSLPVIGESAAGRRFAGSLPSGAAIRIFTGAPMPEGADVVILQEDTRREGDMVTVLSAGPAGRHIRKKGIDFREAMPLIAAGTRLSAADVALAAAMNFDYVPVRRKPRIGLLATGDELVLPGMQPREDQIFSSNHLAVAGLANQAGAEIFDLGIAPDRLDALEASLAQGLMLDLDVLVTLGGASVGEHDLVRTALEAHGAQLDFWRIAMRPGKPMMFAQFPVRGLEPGLRVLGLPGNPVASYVCGIMFLVPLIRAMVGDPLAKADRSEPAVLGSAVGANDLRQDFLRATLASPENGLPIATPFALQDSSILSVLARAEALLIREPHAPAGSKGDACRIIRLS